MIEEYIKKGIVQINKDTVIIWLQENITFTKNLLSQDKFKNDAELINTLENEQSLLDALTTGVTRRDLSAYIKSKIALCKSNRDYFKNEKQQDKPFWQINIDLFSYTLELLKDVKDFYANQQGQLQLF